MSFDCTQKSYKAFRDVAAEGTKRVVAWVGSGLSAAAGLPVWSEFRDSIAAAWESKISTFHPDERAALETSLRVALAHSDYWLSVEKLQEGMGNTTFRDSVREQFREAPRVRVPKAYKCLWQLRLAGMLTLNIDRLATRSYVETHESDVPMEFTGFSVPTVGHVLNSPRPFVINLHGIVEDASSWVLTTSRLRALTAQPGYKDFLRSCLQGNTVFFVGVTVDDIAIGGHLQALTEISKDSGTHYWLTDRCDTDTDNWAENNQIRIIRYSNEQGEHREIQELFDDLAAFVPQDEIPRPVVKTEGVTSPPTLKSASELVSANAEAIRSELNARAAEILAPGTQNAYECFEKFRREYDEPIYRAWYTSLQPPGNQILGYTLLEQVGKGAFGIVYRATDPRGGQVALKVMNQELREHTEMLQSFRRGVRSMKILLDSQVRGMVPYLDASEIPPFVAMEWVDGPNLREAVLARQLDDWPLRLRVFLELTRIIRAAHSLPQRVLHRDVRPSNVMLRNFYAEPGSIDVVVLDFDLSWHVGSLERTAMVGAETTGYLAPEQLHRIERVSTRHAAVDAFGIGMTLFFVVTREDPLPTQHQHGDWSAMVDRGVATLPCSAWRSLPKRVSRVITQSTVDSQSARWDLAQLEAELERLWVALTSPTQVASAELLAEEVVARAVDEYEWNDDKARARVNTAGGLSMTLRGDESKGEVQGSIGWASGGEHSRKRVVKWLRTAGDRVQKALKAGGWTIGTESAWGQEIHVVFSQSVQSALPKLDEVAESLKKAIGHLRFE